MVTENIDIAIGDKFGKWTVLSGPIKKKEKYYYTCECSCPKHTIRDVQKSYLITGRSKSCGCTNHFKINEDMIGKRFGKLTIIEQVESADDNTRWRCKCDCGNETIVKGYRLRTGHTKSCGNCSHVGEVINGVKLVEQLHGAWYRCICPYDGKEFVQLYSKISSGHIKSCGCQANTFIDLTGKIFGKWKVIEQAEDKKYWLCECMCEKHTRRYIAGMSLRAGTSTSCGCISKNYVGSIGENEVRDYISTLTDEEPQKVKILNNKEIDLYYENHNIGIEFNGSVYHASINGIYDNKPKYYHRDKFLCAKEKGIHLVSIFDVDWYSNQDKIKAYLKDLFINPEVIYARKCEVKEILKYDANSFCDTYHLQGSSRQATIYLGLYYNDELCAVMTFGRQRRKKNSKEDFELVRYCVKSGYTVVGGANKLLKFFEETYKPKFIISYSDNDYFTGDIYGKLGFNYSKQVSVSYYWFMNDVELKREECQPKKLEKKYPELYNEALKAKEVDVYVTSVEDYIMGKLKARKVYRCGNTRWEKYYGY